MTITQGTEVVVATSAEDAAAVEAVKQHHAQLAAALAVRVEALVAATTGPTETFEEARGRAVEFLTSELAPHAAAEEDALYPAAATSERARLLVEGMLAEHVAILSLVEELRTAPQPVRAAAAAYALKVLFDVHLAKENDLVLPVVAADPAVSLAAVLEGMHELLGGHGSGGEPTAPPVEGHGAAGQGATGNGGCGCGGSDSAAPELDVRVVPHAIRHATVLGAFDAIGAGESLVLVAPHDPLPLLRQLGDRAHGRLEVTYLERGPQAGRLRLTRG